MATTGALPARRDRRSAGRASDAAPSGRIGVLWGYPFSLVRGLVLAFVALVAVLFAVLWAFRGPGDALQTLVHLLPVAVAILVSMYVAELVGVTERPVPRLRVEAIFAAIGIACLFMAAGYVVLPAYAPPAEFLCAAPALTALAVYLQRRWREIRGGPVPVRAALFAGSRDEAVRALEALQEVGGVSVRALVLPPGASDGKSVAGIPVSSPARGFEEMRAQGIELFVVGRASPEEARGLLSHCAGAGFLVEPVGDLVARNRGCVDLRGGNDLALLTRMTSQARPYTAQRALDILLAGSMFLLTLPLWPLVALAVKLTSRGPVLYRQTRIGLWGRPFEILKFRTMRQDAERETGPVWAAEDDPRITPIGRLLRAARLDELPQLWNVLRGDMSLVGPRPERPYFVQRLAQSIPLYDARHSVRPGITGWAQIRHPYGSSEEDARAKLGYDLFYILHRSVVFYFAVLLETVKVMVFRRGGR